MTVPAKKTTKDTERLNKFRRMAEVVVKKPESVLAVPQSDKPVLAAKEAAAPVSPSQPPAPSVKSGKAEVPAVFADGKLPAPRFMRVRIEETVDNVYNARHIYLPEEVRSMAVTLREDGQLVPGIAVKRQGKYMLIAGHYRKRALLSLGASEMDLMVYENLTDRQIYVMSFRENHNHHAQTTLDNALAWQRLLDDGVYPNDEAIGEDVGLSKPTIFKTLSVLKLESQVLDIVKQDPARFALTALYEMLLLQKVAGVAKTAQAAQQVLDGEIGRDQIRQWRTRLEAASVSAENNEEPAPPAAVNRRARRYPIWSTGQKREVANIREWDSGRVVFETTVTDPIQRARVLEALKTLPVDGKTEAPTETARLEEA